MSEGKAESESFQVLHTVCDLIPSCSSGWEKFAPDTSWFFFPSLFPAEVFLHVLLSFLMVCPTVHLQIYPWGFFLQVLIGSVHDPVVIRAMALLIWDFSPYTTLWGSLVVKEPITPLETHFNILWDSQSPFKSGLFNEYLNFLCHNISEHKPKQADNEVLYEECDWGCHSGY